MVGRLYPKRQHGADGVDELIRRAHLWHNGKSTSKPPNGVVKRVACPLDFSMHQSVGTEEELGPRPAKPGKEHIL